ncbi:MAG: TonB family protein [Nitrospirota bacterium]|nr:TonB family protein [Nitrospirota bacterium]
MQNYGVIISVLIHMLLLSIPLSATVTHFSEQGFGNIKISIIDGSVSPAGDRKVAVSGAAKKRVEKKKEPKPPKVEEKAEERVQQKKETKTVAISSETDAASEAEETDVVRPAEKKEETEVQTVAEPEEDRNQLAQEMLSARAEDSEQGAVSAVSAQDSLQGEFSGKPYLTEIGSADSPAFVRRVLPEYPWIARKMGREGRVLLRLTIDETGRLLNVVVVEKAGFGFEREAVRAVRLSTYRPAVRNGMPVKSEALLYVKFEFEERE